MAISKNTQLILKIANLESHLSKRLEHQLSIHGISFTEFLVMHHLSISPTYSLRRIELAEKVNLSASGVTRLLQPMEKIGLVEKEANKRDARVSLVKLSETGKTIYAEAEYSVNQHAIQLTKALNDKQRSHLLTSIEAML